MRSCTSDAALVLPVLAEKISIQETSPIVSPDVDLSVQKLQVWLQVREAAAWR
jgi:hypothetical protein